MNRSSGGTYPGERWTCSTSADAAGARVWWRHGVNRPAKRDRARRWLIGSAKVRTTGLPLPEQPDGTPRSGPSWRPATWPRGPPLEPGRIPPLLRGSRTTCSASSRWTGRVRRCSGSINADTTVPPADVEQLLGRRGVVLGDYLWRAVNGWLYVVELNRGYDDAGKVSVDPDSGDEPGSDDQPCPTSATTRSSIETQFAFHDGVGVFFANSGGLVQGWDISDLLDGGDDYRRVLRSGRATTRTDRSSSTTRGSATSRARPGGSTNRASGSGN